MAKKTAEQMNAERRAAKARQKHGGKKDQKPEGFSLRSVQDDKKRHQNFKRLLEETIDRALRQPIVVDRSVDDFQRRFDLLRRAESMDDRLILDELSSQVVLGRVRN